MKNDEARMTKLGEFLVIRSLGVRNFLRHWVFSHWSLVTGLGSQTVAFSPPKLPSHHINDYDGK